MAIYKTESVQASDDRHSTIAFVTPSEIENEDLLARLGNKLPRYMIPSAIYQLDCLPKTTNDKIDHRAIAANQACLIQETRSNRLDRYTRGKQTKSLAKARPKQAQKANHSPNMQNIATMRVAKIWQNILNLPEIPNKLDANFFDLGGHRYTAPKKQNNCTSTDQLACLCRDCMQKYNENFRALSN